MPTTEDNLSLKEKLHDIVERVRAQAQTAKEKAVADAAKLQVELENEARVLESFADAKSQLQKESDLFERFASWTQNVLAGDEYRKALRAFSQGLLYAGLQTPNEVVTLKFLAEHKEAVLTEARDTTVGGAERILAKIISEHGDVLRKHGFID